MNSKEIHFEKLQKLKIKRVGVFGSRQEVLDTLFGFSAISTAIVDALKSDDEDDYLLPGIHAILPVNLHQDGYRWDEVIYIFYWPMDSSFDMEQMKAVKYMRKVRILWIHLALKVCF